MKFETLKNHAFEINFFRAVRSIQAGRQAFPRVGHSKKLSQDPVRFGQQPSLSFAPSTLQHVALTANGQCKLFQHFFGLFGPNGALPHCITEFALQRQLNALDLKIGMEGEAARAEAGGGATGWEFKPGDFKDIIVFAASLQDKSHPFSPVVLRCLTDTTRKLLANVKAAQFAVEPYQSTLLRELNRAMLTQPLFDPAACKDWEIPQEITQLYRSRLQGPHLLRANRLLLETIYQDAMAVRKNRNSRDTSLPGFLDVFHHRMTSFFFRAWADNQITVDLDRPGLPQWDEAPRFPSFVGSFIGMGWGPLQRGDSIPFYAKLYYAGRLAPQPKNPEGFEAVVSDYFGIRCELHRFIGRWIDLPAENHCRMGESPRTGLLGSTAIAGTRIWDCQMSFRIRLGPMGLRSFESLLPNQPGFQHLRDWVRNYFGEEFFWDAQLVLKKEEVPPCTLGGSSRLGWTTWIGTGPLDRDPEDVILSGN